MLHTISDRRVPHGLAAAAVGGLLGGLCLMAPELAVVAVAAVAGALLVLRHPIVLCYVMVAAVTLVSGVTRGKLVPLLRPNELLLAVSIACTALIVLTTKDRWNNIRRSGYVWAAFGVLTLGTVLIPVVYHHAQAHPASLEAMLDVVSPFKFFMLFVVFATIPLHARDWHRIVIWMLVCSAIVSLVGLLQAAGVGPVRDVIGTWYASEHTEVSLESLEGRITSLMGAWNTLGMLLMAALTIGWAALQVPELRRYRLLVLGLMIVNFLCLVASGSFAGLFGTVVSVLIVERLTNPLGQTLKKLALALGLAVAGMLLALPVLMTVVESRLMYQFGDGELLPQTFVYRFWIWTDVFWPEIVKHPLLGTALEIYPYYRWLFAESHYISLLFRFGVVGLAAHMLWVVLMLGWLQRRLTQADQFTRMMAAAAIATLVVLSISALSNEVFLFTGSVDFMWILFALVANQKELKAV